MPTTSYDKILQEISEIYELSQQQGTENWNQSVLYSHWKIGEKIITVEQNQALRAEYGARVLVRLSQDLKRKLGSGFSARNLRYMRQFYTVYRKKTFHAGISWSHYRELLSIPEESVRLSLERKILKQNLSVRDLQSIIKEKFSAKEDLDQNSVMEVDSRVELESRKSGNNLLRRPVLVLYTYRVDQKFSMNLAHSVPNLDLGFRVKYGLGGISDLKKGDILSIRKIKGKFSFEKIAAVRELFTYIAYLDRVIDGDTLLVHVDLGFGIFIQQRLRLRGIDAPELGTPMGNFAQRFVESELRDTNLLIIKTYGSDMYDRYLVDVFYLAGEEDMETIKKDGRFLNNLLLEEGLAVRFP